MFVHINVQHLVPTSIVNPHPQSNIPFSIPVSAISHTSGSSNSHRTSQSPYVVLALEDTFRIPTRGSDSAEELDSSASGSRRCGCNLQRDSEEDLVVIPPLGDREVKDAWEVLANERMEIDNKLDELGMEPEIEWDCISSQVPWRSSSPGPSLSPPLSNNCWTPRWRVEALSRIGARVLDRTSSGDGVDMDNNNASTSEGNNGGDFRR
ncbi:uncharacterized protein C8R40DRAFT_1165875 [Lentinula edodes]|uniref:uncharacterized protein n=1 Tax=Lentinula edodes TaxID=5353 RepID=UPI001E8D1446|nr:uncharacterized protein C8R40DRAFT_1165875 [Lentinula edodes]KAH7879618.1 hypothetical protein C8R40DRAFT_1165875 [Lentinula edodes]